MGREILDLPAPAADVRIGYGDGEFHFGDLRLPKRAGPHPLVITIHGGFWRAQRQLTYMGHICEKLRAEDVATWNIEYRRVGQEGGGYPGTLEDVAAACQHVKELAREYPLDLSRVVAVGHSAGGQLALCATASLRGVVGLGAVVDLRRGYELNLGDGAVKQFMGRRPVEAPEAYKRASPIENVPPSVPVRLVHGDADDIVPIEIAERYEWAARAAGGDCGLIRLPGADHFVVVDPRAAEWPVVQSAILGCLG
jgi:acetyl esterase/lipase